MNHKILFLGPPDSPVLEWLKKNDENVFSTEEKITKDFVINKSFNFLISYGYRFILKKEILDLFSDRAINLHISLLPFNRGADPNFWSFIEGTPKGVTIHYLDEGIDTGDIIVQKEISFVYLEDETLSSTYYKLQKEIQNLFFQNWSLIKSQTNNRTSQEGFSTSHKVKDKDDLLFLMEPDGCNTRVTKLIDYSEQNKIF
jgi:methionyl-tRNA formyltransferase